MGLNMLTRDVVVIDLKVLHVNHTGPGTWQLTCTLQWNPILQVLL